MNELSIIIPVLSGFESLPLFIDGLVHYLKANLGDVDVIVVVDETVKTPETIIVYVKGKYPWMKLRVLQRTGKGSIQNFGAMVRFGMAYSTSKYVVLVSSHGADDLSAITKMLKIIREGAQLVQATRYSAINSGKNIGSLYKIYQTIYRFVILLLTGLKISDSTYSFKMFDRLFIQALGITRNRFSICPEITIKSLLANGKVEYIPSTVKPIKDLHDFKLRREWLGCVLVVVRACLHRCGVCWF